MLPSERMGSQRTACHGVIVSAKTYRCRIAYIMHDLDAVASLVQTEAFARQNASVALCVQLRETLAKFEGLSVDLDRTVSALLALCGIGRQVRAARPFAFDGLAAPWGERFPVLPLDVEVTCRILRACDAGGYPLDGWRKEEN